VQGFQIPVPQGGYLHLTSEVLLFIACYLPYY
jgi:hypothetical protein